MILTDPKSNVEYIGLENLSKNNPFFKDFDSIKDDESLEIGRWIVAGVTVFTFFLVYVPMLCAANEYKSEISFIGEYGIVVYDTLE